MCLRPKYITVDRTKTHLYKLEAYDSVLSKYAWPELRQRVDPYRFDRVKVPCGCCSECLRARQSDLASRVALAAQQYGSMFHLTLTYAENEFPLCARQALVDECTGEIILDKLPIQLMRLKKSDELSRPFDFSQIYHFHEQIEKLPRKPEARVLEVRDPSPGDPDGWTTYYYVTPSLHRRDVRMWLKRSRVKYEREFGKKLSDFKYVLCGEFGPKTCRPHYHILLLGLTVKEARYLQKEWSYGFSKLKHVKEVNADGTSGYAISAKYVAKYIVKGEFDADCVKNGYVERPRVCLSRFIGTTIPDELVSYFRCYDLFGRYGLDDLILDHTRNFVAPRQLTLEQLSKLYSEFRKRAVLRFGVSSWSPLPKVIYKRLFSVSDTYYSFEYDKDISFTRRSLVQMAFESFVESDFLADFISELTKDSSLSEAEINYRISAFLSSEKASRQIKDEAGKKAFRQFYAQSRY